jgi:hypothetical protein
MKNNEERIDGSDDVTIHDQFQGGPVIIYTVRFDRTIALIGDQSDFIRLTVQDDLSGVEILNSQIRKWEAI